MKNFFLNGTSPGYTFEFETTASDHGGTGLFINDNLWYKARNNFKIFLDECLESIFIAISFII